MTGAEMKIPTPEELEAMLARGELKRIGDGSRRICYAIGDSGLCLKGYRREEDLDSRMRPDGSLETHPLKSSTVREIRAARFDERKNTSCQEWRSYQELKAKLPQELFASFPETLERVLVPSFGWCLVENLIVNADGSPVQKFAPVYRNADEPLKKTTARRPARAPRRSHAARRALLRSPECDGAVCRRRLFPSAHHRLRARHTHVDSDRHASTRPHPSEMRPSLSSVYHRISSCQRSR